MHPIAFTAAALLIEAAAGYPDALFRAVGHPVVWVGALIGALDRRWNPDGPRGDGGGSRGLGVLALVVVVVAAVGGAAVVAVGVRAIVPGWGGVLVLAVLGSSLVAQRSLFRHVAAVRGGLARGVAEGRTAVAHIVGRDTGGLDAAGVARAAIESLAENFADGVVAPALWGAVLGLAGMALYKAVNTADSMIGHRTPRHARFGWASARLDDGLNLPASRLAALWIVLAAAVLPGMDARRAWRAVRRDAGRHRSLNAGWPEAAMAGALGVRLAGPRVYGGVVVADAWMGDGRAAVGAADIGRALLVYRVACGLQLAAYAGVATALLR